MKLQLSKRTLMLIPLFMAATNSGSVVAFAETMPKTDMVYTDVAYGEKYTNLKDGQMMNTLNEADILESVIMDARNDCSGGLKCCIASTNNTSLVAEPKFELLGLDVTRVANYAISISKRLMNARGIMIVKTYGDTQYIHDLFNSYIVNRYTAMKDVNNVEQMEIAKNAIITDIGEYTCLAMTPNSEQTMKVLVDGLTLLV